MKLKIKELILTTFKGTKQETVKLGESVNVVSGANGSGKTTLATAWNWLMADKDYDLHSNPNIRPLDIEECTPRVEAILDVDGKNVNIAKQQVMKKSKPNADGISKVSLSNSYEINSVPKSERDFKAYLSDLGVDFDLFLSLSHPEVFAGQKAPEMRKILFSMTSGKTDYDIAVMTNGVNDVKVLLQNYTLDEIKAMQNATLRKIREDYGKDGEILRAKIEGLESAKVDIDVAELELLNKALTSRLNENLEKQEDLSKLMADMDARSDGIIEAKMKLSQMQRDANAQADRARADIRNDLASIDTEKRITEHALKMAECDLKTNQDDISALERKLQQCREEWIKVSQSKMDESSLVCPYCKQCLPENDVEEKANQFEIEKIKELKKLENTGAETKALLKERKQEFELTKAKIADIQSKMEFLRNKTVELEGKLLSVAIVDVSQSPEYISLENQIADMENAMIDSNEFSSGRMVLRIEENEIRQEISANEKRIATFSNNIRIDEQIAALRDKQLEYEQSRADAENILNQIDLLSRKKNELLEADINRHFSLVKWKLYDYQKNGEYKEVCVPQYCGKDLSVSTNTGLEVMMKMDIIHGLQKFYGQHYPVFLDGAECLDSRSMSSIQSDCQLIYLVVNEEKTLSVREICA